MAMYAYSLDVVISYAALVEMGISYTPSAEVGTPYASLAEVVISLVEVGTHAGLVDIGILYTMCTLVEVGVLHFLSVEVVAVTCWLSVETVVMYMYSWSWEVELLSPVAVYAALGDSSPSLVLDWYATLSVMFSLLVFFLRHTNTVIKMTAVVMSTNNIPATPTPIKNDVSFTIAPVLCKFGVVEAATVVTDTGGVATGLEGRNVSFKLK